MSGGVDSSVAASLLVREGYDVIGGFMKNWSDTKDLWTGECEWRGERRDAMRVAAKLGIPLLTFDFEEAYRAHVVNDLFRGYEAGETPNPDVLCNEFIKFGLFFEEAMRRGCEYVAMGHYARVIHSQQIAHHKQQGTETECRLFRGVDSTKDQSYFLYRVPQNVLRRTIFPIGHLHKSEVRKIAHEMNLPVAKKPDSQGICFIGKLNMVEFLRKKIPSRPGKIVDEHGNVLGQHEGLDGYTIGQRHRIHVSRGEEPWYVAQKNVKMNTLVIVQGSEHPQLFRSDATIRDLHWISGQPPTLPLECDVQMRYRQEPVRATMTQRATDNWQLQCEKPVKAIAPGQSAVLYSGDECLGGGKIISAH